MPDESAADDGESSDDDVSQLRDIVAKQHSRINHLEQQVAALDEEPTIGRRGIVGTIAAAVGLGGFAGYGSQHASAQASGPGGQQGTPEEPNDMFAWDLDVQNGAAFNGSDVTGVGELDVEDAAITNTLSEHHYEDGPSDVSASRSIGSTVQNTTGTAILWSVQIEATADNTEIWATTMNVGSTNDAADNFNNFIVSFPDEVVDTGWRSDIKTVVVPNDYYFRLRSSGDVADISIGRWHEREWRVNP